ncbi:MAG: fused MFS/spermidine synthase, partial [Candidatus Edwardsbacteria bacterium]
MNKNAKAPIFFLFFLSGFCGLIYELVWVRLLTLVMGNTAFSISTVLTVFMAGLALGSYLAGKFTDKWTKLLWIYGILEGGVGLSCLVIPHIIQQGFLPVYKFIYTHFNFSFYVFSLIRFLLCGLVLLVPTTLMGATLPVLSKAVVREYKNLAKNIGWLYGINTLGAVAGCFLTGFLLLSKLGVKATNLLAVLGNLSIFISIFAFTYFSKKISKEEKKEKIVSRKEEKKEGTYFYGIFLLFSFALSGFTAMVYEVTWTRALALIIGPTVYSFSLVLTSFLFGLALGSMVFARFFDRKANLFLIFGIVEILIALLALLLLPILGRLPFVIVEIIKKYYSSYNLLLVIEFLIVFILLLFPTLLFGLTFPLVAKIYATEMKVLGKKIGNAYAANTIGAILGSFFAGFLFLPWLGLKGTVNLAMIINLILGSFLFLLTRFRLKEVLIVSVIVIIFILGLYSIPPWDQKLLSSGVYNYALKWENIDFEKERDKIEILYYRDGAGATVSVRKLGRWLSLQIDGKTDASNRIDMQTQVFSAHLPLILQSQPENILIIGLASGVTLGSTTRYREIKKIDCLEISPEVVEASQYFTEYNYNALADNRVNLRINDGRNHLLLTEQKYDVIISEPSNLWLAGIATLFTSEFFNLAKERLKPGGLLCQWIHTYQMSSQNLKNMFYTFQKIFPYTTLWISDREGGDLLLIGSSEEIQIDWESISEKLRDKKIKEDLSRIEINTPDDFLKQFLMGEKELTEYAKGGKINSDDNGLLEFSTPRDIYENTLLKNLLFLGNYRGGLSSQLTNIFPEKLEELKNLREANWHCILAKHQWGVGRDEEGGKELRMALEFSLKRGETGKKMAVEILNHLAGFYKVNRWTEEEIKALELLTKLDSTNVLAYGNLGAVYSTLGEWGKAINAFDYAAKLQPNNIDVHLSLAFCYETKGDFKMAKR